MDRMASAKKKTKSVDEIVIPDKLYFRIGEVSELASLPAYVLRFWETEFPQFKPSKSGTGQRMYRRRDVENILLVKKLLYEEGYTIAGAREKLKQDSKPRRAQSALPFAAPTAAKQGELKRVRHELVELLQMLKSKPRAKK
jgi:DNA-binding transcriptional MerR regulator